MKVKPNQHEIKAIVRGIATLVYLQNLFYEKYPNGVPELLEIQNLIDTEDPTDGEGYYAAAKLVVDETVSDLLWIVEKYK